jgi:hypothetical protein
MSRLVRPLLFVALAAACTGAGKDAGKDASKPAPPSVAKPSAPDPNYKFPVVVKSDAAGTVEAHFEGEAPPPELKVPLVFGAERLFFTFKDSKTALVFKPEGELFFSDWSFDIFSPDGKWVLLLQDRFGPYHVVATSRLADYLQGKAKPDKVVTVPRPEGQQALVHSGAKWVSPAEIEYRVGGETQETKRATVP